MKHRLRHVITTLCLVAAVSGAQADLLGSLKSQAGNYAMPALGSNSIGSVAGVLQYCVKNNYLGSDATSVKDKLLGKAKACDYVLQNAGKLV